MTIEEYVQGLRDFADWAEAHADEFASWTLDDALGPVMLYRPDVESLAQTARALGGHRTKDANGSYFTIIRSFGPVDVHAYSDRNEVCERVVTGTKVIPATVIPAREIPERVEEIVEWKCPDGVLGRSPDTAADAAPEVPFSELAIGLLLAETGAVTG